jgi:hypothetical protein
MQQLAITRAERDRQKLEEQKHLNPPLPTDPDEAAALALASILDPYAKLLPGEIFKELARRNAAIDNAPEAEIKATLSRQIALMEATATRLLQKATTATTSSAANEFIRTGLMTQRVLIQALGAVHAMDRKGEKLAIDHDDGG